MEWHIIHDADGVIRSQIRDVDGQAEAHDQRVLAKHPGGGLVISSTPADSRTQMVADGMLISRPAAPVLISAHEFVARFSETEKSTVMTTPELAPLALAVLTAPNGIDVTDAMAQQARTALEAAGWSDDRLDAIFAIPG